jgi:L-lactate dehydrogenase
MPVSSRVAIVGAGNVGATAAYALMLRGLFAEIVIIDKDADRAVAEATDIADANAIARPARIWAGDYTDVKDADVLVLTAGAATHGDETRTAIASKSAIIVRACVADAMQGSTVSSWCRPTPSMRWRRWRRQPRALRPNA